MRPDPKPAPRVKDPAAVAAAKLLYPWCVACGAGPDVGLNGHHVLLRSQGGDDVVGNIVCLCGSGTTRCHGAFHGTPYTVTVGHGTARVAPMGFRLADSPAEYVERRNGAWVAAHAGVTIRRSRPDVVAYLSGKLGEVAGRDYLDRHYPEEAV